MRMNRRISLFMAASALALAATGVSAQDKEPFRVAMVVAKTGVLATVLGPAGTGFEAHIDAVNAAGGIDGRMIELDQMDEQSAPNVAAAHFQRVLSDPPHALVFFGQSTSQTQSRQLLANGGIPVLTVTADDSFMYPTPTKTMFQVGPTALQQAEALVRVAASKAGSLEGKKIATASVQTTFSDALIQNIVNLADKYGYEVVTSERFPAGIPSFASQGANIARLEPDAVLVLAGNADGPLVVSAISDAGVTDAPIVGYTAISSTEMFQKVNIPNYYAFRSSNVAGEAASLVETVKGTRFETDMGNTWWGAGWVVGNVLTQAMSQCGEDCDGAKLIEALETKGPFEVPHNLLFGPVNFSPENHGGMSTIQAYSWNGSAVVTDGDPIDTAAD